MINIDKIKEILKDMNLRAVAKGAGIHENSLYRIMAGQSCRFDTLSKIVVYLQRKGFNLNG